MKAKGRRARFGDAPGPIRIRVGDGDGSDDDGSVETQQAQDLLDLAALLGAPLSGAIKYAKLSSAEDGRSCAEVGVVRSGDSVGLVVWSPTTGRALVRIDAAGAVGLQQLPALPVQTGSADGEVGAVARKPSGPHQEPRSGRTGEQGAQEVVEALRLLVAAAMPMAEKNVDPAKPDDCWMSVKEAARYAGVSADTIRSMVNGGQIPRGGAGRRVLVRRSDLDQSLMQPSASVTRVGRELTDAPAMARAILDGGRSSRAEFRIRRRGSSAERDPEARG